MSLQLSPKDLCPLCQPRAVPSLLASSFSQGEHLLKSSRVLLRLSFSMSQSGHRLYLHAGMLGSCRDLSDGAMVGKDLKGAIVLQGMFPFCSQSSTMKIHSSAMPMGEMTWQEEDMQPVGTSHACSTAALNTPRTHPKPCAKTNLRQVDNPGHAMSHVMVPLWSSRYMAHLWDQQLEG